MIIASFKKTLNPQFPDLKFSTSPYPLIPPSPNFLIFPSPRPSFLTVQKNVNLKTNSQFTPIILQPSGSKKFKMIL